MKTKVVDNNYTELWLSYVENESCAMFGDVVDSRKLNNWLSLQIDLLFSGWSI